MVRRTVSCSVCMAVMLVVAATGNSAHAAPCTTPDPRNITVPLYDPGTALHLE